jgi:hypothetical protein
MFLPFLNNVGIAVYPQTTNLYFSNNTFTVSPAQYTNAYYGIAVDQMFLNSSFTNIISNSFVPNGGLGDGVYAYGYGLTFSSNYPNNTSNTNIEANAIETGITNQNTF